ncbi:helix-turn-helix domain-containing protein [Saccharopolyspora shandongensis]
MIKAVDSTKIQTDTVVYQRSWTGPLAGSLTAPEREAISRGLSAGCSYRAIAASLERAVSTISREVSKNGVATPTGPPRRRNVRTSRLGARKIPACSQVRVARRGCGSAEGRMVPGAD